MSTHTMRTPPLIMKQYFVTDFRLQANRNYEPSDDDAAVDDGVTVAPIVAVAPLSDADDNRDFAVELTVELAETPAAGSESSTARYAGRICLWGQFTVDASWPTEKLGALLNITAASILYSAARESVAMLSGRFPWGPLLLPTVSFQPAPSPKQELTEGPESDGPPSDEMGSQE